MEAKRQMHSASSTARQILDKLFQGLGLLSTHSNVKHSKDSATTPKIAKHQKKHCSFYPVPVSVLSLQF